MLKFSGMHPQIPRFICVQTNVAMKPTPLHADDQLVQNNNPSQTENTPQHKHNVRLNNEVEQNDNSVWLSGYVYTASSAGLRLSLDSIWWFASLDEWALCLYFYIYDDLWDVPVDPNGFDWSDLLHDLIEWAKHWGPAVVKWCVGSAIQILPEGRPYRLINMDLESFYDFGAQSITQ